MKTRIGAAVALLFVTLGLAAQESSPPPQGGRPAGQQGGVQEGFHLLPRFAVERLNLSDDQLKQIAELEKETKAKLSQILSPDQMKTLEEMRPPRPGQGAPGEGEVGPAAVRRPATKSKQ